MDVRTSSTHPIRVDFIPKHLHGLAGQLGMTFAPGKKAQGIDGHWDRDLTVDLVRLRQEYSTDILVSLIEEHELGTLGIQTLSAAAAHAGIVVDRFGIPDGGVPADGAKFVKLVERTILGLWAGKTVVIHCRGGLGRTGVLAAVCLRALGIEADRAIHLVRAARKDTIENAEQERFVRQVELLTPDSPGVHGDERASPIDQPSNRASSEERPIHRFEWHGTLQRDSYNAWALEARDAIAEAAKAYDWPAAFDLLERHQELVNAWRPGGVSWYAPLHQAAHGGASVDVVERLLALGAWRTLRTAKGERPVDIARRRGNHHLVTLLEPRPLHTIDAHVLERVQGHFHEVIRGRVARLAGVLRTLRLPELGPVTEYASANFWFAVPGMYGGFAFWLSNDGAAPRLVTESWCRVVGGSGQRHEVTAEGAQLVDQGFV